MKKLENLFDFLESILFLVAIFWTGPATVILTTGFLVDPTKAFDWSYNHPQLMEANPFNFLSSFGVDEYTSTFLYNQNYKGLILCLVVGVFVFIFFFILGISTLIKYFRLTKEVEKSEKERKVPFGEVKNLKRQEELSTQIKKSAPYVEFPKSINSIQICLTKYLGDRMFLFDPEKNKSYFQITSSDYPDYPHKDGAPLVFTPKNNFTLVLHERLSGTDIFAEIEGVPTTKISEVTQKNLSEFLNEDVTYVN